MLKKLFGLLTSAAMVAIGLVSYPLLSQPAEAAPPGSAFDPGLIISDSVFFDFGSMSLEEIQSFLDSRVQNCRADDPALDCLKNYRTDIPETPATLPGEVGPCAAIPAKAGATAAEVIYLIANACGINPKVLIVTLQKEQGLVTSTKPTDYMYRAAMGFGCPDSDPAICGKVYVGLFNQLYRAAKQFRWYGNPEGSFTYWKPGRTVAMRYHPRSSCGTKSFVLQNQATANLYYYTPYTPNDAALNNLYGTGDSCSAYGNRNFWRFFHDWFGSPIGGGYLLKSAGSENYLIVDNKKYLVSDARLLSSMRPLGPLGEISQAYLDSFETAGAASQLVKTRGTDSLNLLVDGVRYQVSDCTLAQHFGQSCDTAIELTSLQVNNFVDGGPLTRLVQNSTGARFWIENGASRVVVDDLALATVGASGASPTMMTIEQLTGLSIGPALASELVSFGLVGSTDIVVVSQGKSYRFDGSLATETQLRTWFKQSGLQLPLEAIGPSLQPNTVSGFIRDSAGRTFVITENGKLPVADPENWTSNVVQLTDAMMQAIPDVQGELASPAMVSFKGTSNSYFVQSAQRRTSTSSSMTTEFLNLLRQEKVIEVPKSAIVSVAHAGIAMAPGSIIKASNSKTLYLVDDLTFRLPLASTAQATSVSDSRTFTFSASQVRTLTSRPGLTNGKVSCNGENYLLDNGTLYPVSNAVFAHYPGAAFPLSTTTCAAMKLATKPAGQFVRASNKAMFFVEDGKRKRVSNWSHYQRIVGEGPGYFYASSFFLSTIPESGKVGNEVELADASNFSSGNFGSLTFGGTLPQAPSAPAPAPTQSPAPVVTPSPTASPTPSPAPSTPANPTEYRVVSGDTMQLIAARFNVSVAALQELNGISNPNLIRVGQLLRIPSTAPSPTPSPTPTPSATPSASPTPTPAPSPSETTDEPAFVEYRVQSGDTLLRIGGKFGVSASVIQEFNNISNPNRIRVGQLLKIPTSAASTNIAPVTQEPAPQEPKTYRVVAGDTLWGIARKLGVSASKLAEVNNINNANFIRVGQLLTVPS